MGKECVEVVVIFESRCVSDSFSDQEEQTWGS